MSREWRIQDLISGAVLLIFGLVLMLRPGMTLNVIAQWIGAVIIIIGIIFIISYFWRSRIMAGGSDFIIGVIILCAGIFVMVRTGFVVSILPVVMGLAVILSGLLKLQDSLNMHSAGIPSWKGICIAGIISIVFGLIVVLNPFSTMVLLMRIVGAGFIYSGATDIFSAVYVHGKMRGRMGK